MGDIETFLCTRCKKNIAVEDIGRNAKGELYKNCLKGGCCF